MKINYRSEIDGLRAIAVIAVILYHAQVTISGYSPFKGGFIGVDIFLVISGYLITSIIYKELVTTGNFSFKNFYERRVRRIIPALLFVIVLSLPLFWMYLLPNKLVEFAKSILYSLGFSSNFYFWFTGLKYGADDSLLLPFLHTWSLAVEEQYYILFPIIFLFIFKYLKKYLLKILILIGVISIIVADWGSRSHPSFNFYILPTRGWELIAGSLLAYFEINFGRENKNINKNLKKLLPILGLILVLHAIFFFNDEMFHPSFYTLSPIIGTCLIIWYLQKDTFLEKILSSKLFVGIGLISYSLYLWHYPLFAFARITELTHGSIINKIILLVIIVLLSVFSYFFIEKPARDKKKSFNLILIVIFITTIIISSFSILIIKKEGFKSRISQSIIKNINIESSWELLKNNKGEKCFDNKNNCIFNKKSNRKVYIIGDSHMGALIYDLKDKTQKNNYQFITSTFIGCLYFPGFDKVKQKSNKIDKKCNNEYFINLEKKLLSEKNSIIILGGRLPLYLSGRSFDNLEGGMESEGRKWKMKFSPVGNYKDIESSFKFSVSKLLKNDHKIILIYPIPEVGWNVPQKLLNLSPKKISEINEFFKFNFKTEDYITTSFQVYKDRTESSFNLLDSVKGKNVYRIYPHKLFCNTIIKDRCTTHNSKNIFYDDDDHTSLKGSQMINDLIIKKIKKIDLKQ